MTPGKNKKETENEDKLKVLATETEYIQNRDTYNIHKYIQA